MKIKNSHSSNGSPAIASPKVYLVSNHHTPLLVNQTSQAIKNTATSADAFKNGMNSRSNRSRLSKDATKQIMTVKNKISE